MSKCWHCGKQSIFLKLGSSGLCVDCLEISVDTSDKLLARIRKGGDIRKQTLLLIDKEIAVMMAHEAESQLQKSPFGIWNESVHATVQQLERVRSSTSVQILSYQDENKSAQTVGSTGELYTTTFSSCTCGDFAHRHLPCKHMYKLAATRGGIDFSYFLK